jgi:hypothetical protein
MKWFTNRWCMVFAASLFGGLGASCGAVGPEESISETHEAISNWGDLVTMPSTGNYTLTADINAAGQTWTSKDFSGTFDGGNHTISNLTLSASFFGFLSNATIKNVRFTNLRLTASSGVNGYGGIARYAENSTIENCALEGNINVNTFAAGGLVGTMLGGRIFRSYAKGTLGGSVQYSGGLVGIAAENLGIRPSITESYAQMTVNPTSSDPSAIVTAGGIVGYGYATDIHDVYAVGNVSGRGAVGGIIGNQECVEDQTVFFLFKTIYRGQVLDRNRSWAGGVGTFLYCTGSRMEQNFYDNSLDQSGGRANHHSIQGYSTTDLKRPTSVIGGVYCAPDLADPARCGDNTWMSPPWTAGTSEQHHALRNMPGPNVQPR